MGEVWMLCLLLTAVCVPPLRWLQILNLGISLCSFLLPFSFDSFSFQTYSGTNRVRILNWLIKYKLFEHFVTKQSSCAQHTEAKPTKTSDFGAVKGLLQSQAGRMGGLCSKPLIQSMVWGEKLAGCMTFFWLVDGKFDRAVLQESCVQRDFTLFHLGGVLSSAEELQYTVMCIP